VTAIGKPGGKLTRVRCLKNLDEVTTVAFGIHAASNGKCKPSKPFRANRNVLCLP
jgi:hypothetical protein